MHHNYQKEIFSGNLDAPAQSLEFEPPEGLLPEKIGLWISLTLGDPSNIITVAAEWSGTDDVWLETFANNSQTVTANCILTLCNPGGATKLRLQLSSTGEGDDLTVNAKTNVED